MKNFVGTLVPLLTVAFIVLRLCHVIDWSWWWVLSPLWIAASLLVLLMIGVTLYWMYSKDHADI